MVCSVVMHTASTAAVGASSLGLVATLALIVLLVAKVLLVPAGRSSLVTLSQSIDVAIMPLLIVFVAIVAVNVVSAL